MSAGAIEMSCAGVGCSPGCSLFSPAGVAMSGSGATVLESRPLGVHAPSKNTIMRTASPLQAAVLMAVTAHRPFFFRSLVWKNSPCLRPDLPRRLVHAGAGFAHSWPFTTALSFASARNRPDGMVSSRKRITTRPAPRPTIMAKVVVSAFGSAARKARWAHHRLLEMVPVPTKSGSASRSWGPVGSR